MWTIITALAGPLEAWRNYGPFCPLFMGVHGRTRMGVLRRPDAGDHWSATLIAGSPPTRHRGLGAPQLRTSRRPGSMVTGANPTISSLANETFRDRSTATQPPRQQAPRAIFSCASDSSGHLPSHTRLVFRGHDPDPCLLSPLALVHRHSQATWNIRRI